MKFFNIFLTIFLTIGVSAQAHAEKFRIQDRGMDGNVRGYNVTCEDGNTGSVTMEYKLPEFPENITEDMKKARMVRGTGETTLVQVCILPQSGGQKCQPQWDLKDAAKASCR